MKKIIVTTTIYPPSQATLKFCQMEEWDIIIVGDLSTPHALYKKLAKKYKNVTYLDSDIQKKKHSKISKLIGWKSIQRRNIGFIEAYRMGADIVATVDDDNIPYKNWGENLLVAKEIELDCYEPSALVFDPLSITKNNFIWHRGYPIQLLDQRLNVKSIGKIKRKVLIQADLWDGNPDIDAIARIVYKNPVASYKDVKKPYCSNKISPFNSQNTFLHRSVLPYYAVLPHIGRMDDIWGSYIVQHYFPNSLIYNKASTYQDRNTQDPVVNLEKELFGYKETNNLLDDLQNFIDFLPKQTRTFWLEYRKQYDQ